jgi:hypothetical protein
MLGKRFMATAQLLSLCAMAWFVWVNRIDPKLAHEPLGAVLREAFGWLCFAWVWSALITLGIFAAVVRDRTRERHLLAASLPGIWFAPAIILISTLSPAGLAIGLALVLAATRRLLAYWVPADTPAREQPKAYAFEIDTAFLKWNSVPVLIAAAVGQAGLVALLFHDRFFAAAGFAMTVAILVGQSAVRGAYEQGTPPAMPPSGMGMVLTFLLAFAVTTSSIQVGIMSRPGSGSNTPDSDESPGVQVTELQNPPRSATEGGGFDGVILRTKVAATHPTILIAPAARTTSGISKAAPVSIPFSGEYWMFQAPWRQPPPWSVRKQGKPTEVSFHTTNGRPMQMSADQKLNGPVDMAWCARIQVLIARVGDDPAVFELILSDSESRRFESLGIVEAAGNILDFPIPASVALDQFDEIRVVYHRPANSSERSARIAIEGFVIAPR